VWNSFNWNENTFSHLISVNNRSNIMRIEFTVTLRAKIDRPSVEFLRIGGAAFQGAVESTTMK